MSKRVEIGFSLEPITVPVEDILGSKVIDKTALTSSKYLQIKASISEIGLIEPLSIAPFKRNTRDRVLLDGHSRLQALIELGRTEAICIVATDDEGYTYNNQVNRVSTVQEYHMLRLAVARGVPPQKIAKVFNVDASHIAKKLTMLSGVCTEAVELLKDRQFSLEVTRVLRKMKPMRQVECVELMVSANRFTVTYLKAMLAATAPALLVDGGASRTRKRSIADSLYNKMEREMVNVQSRYKTSEQTYGEDMLNLVLARGYVGKLLENAAVSKYLRSNEQDIFEQFEQIVKSESLD